MRVSMVLDHGTQAKSQVGTVCQDIADSLGRRDNNRFFKGTRFSST
jgi:hypothetical protein